MNQECIYSIDTYKHGKIFMKHIYKQKQKWYNWVSLWKINYVKWSFIISFANFAKFNNSLELSELNNWHILKVFGRIL